MCWNMHKAYSGEKVTRRARNPMGGWSTLQIPIPEAVKNYNRYMGGVDLSDALIRYYNVSAKWYKTFFFFFTIFWTLPWWTVLFSTNSWQKNRARPLSPKRHSGRHLCLSWQMLHHQSHPLLEQQSHPPLEMCKMRNAFLNFFGVDGTAARRKCAFGSLAGKTVKTPVYCTKFQVLLCSVPAQNCFRSWLIERHKLQVLVI